MSYIPNPHPNLASPTPNGQARVDFLAWFNEGFVVTDGHLLANPANPELIYTRLLPEAYTQLPIKPVLAIMHTQAGNGKASNDQVYGWLAREDVKLEPHIIGPEMVTGAMLQVVPFDRKADCNLAANRFVSVVRACWAGAVSFEMQDLGGKTLDNTPMTERQLQSVVGLLTAACATYEIPCIAVPKTTQRTMWKGLSYHAKNGEWSASSHSCPGASRIAQFPWVVHEVATRLAHVYGAWGIGCPS